MKKRQLAVVLLATMLCNLTPVFGKETTPVLAPSAMIMTQEGSLLIADVYQNAIWEQEIGGPPTRVAGRVGVLDVNGDPIGGYHDSTGTEAAFASPWALAKFNNGYAVSDTQNHVIRFFYDDKVSTIAGTVTPGMANGLGIKATFSHPTGLATDPATGALYVADTGNNLIRKIDTKGNVTTFAGNGEGCADGTLTTAKFYEPTALFFKDGVLYVADSGNHRICKIQGDTVTTIAGSMTGEAGLVDGKAMEARFEAPQGLWVEGDRVFVADTGNGAVRMVEHGTVSTLLSMGALASGLYPVSPRGLVLTQDTLYIGDVFSRVLIPLPLTDATKAAMEQNFSDVPADAWFAPSVKSVSEKALMLGTSDTLFSPKASTTRGMAVTVLSRIDAENNVAITGTHSFVDVGADAYFANPIAWANSNNIVSGVSKTEFMPNKALTRGELVSILYRYATKKEAPSLSQTGDLTVFSDVETLPDYSKDAFAWACATGLVVGDEEKALHPMQNVTRAEFAAMIDRFLSLT